MNESIDVVCIGLSEVMESTIDDSVGVVKILITSQEIEGMFCVAKVKLCIASLTHIHVM